MRHCVFRENDQGTIIPIDTRMGMRVHLSHISGSQMYIYFPARADIGMITASVACRVQLNRNSFEGLYDAT